ncbi:MAG: LPS export ABC transporter permease LptG [Proteobacteria bacterium]|nr:LPS export ABC transporter permease LptG [Pseudomonadota bacterium]
MRLSSVLSVYIGRNFLGAWGAAMAALAGLILLFDLAELLRRASAKPETTFGLVVQMSLLRLPYMAEEVVPFAVLFGGMFAFWRLTRSSELVVARAAGVSVWQFLLPVLLLSLLIGAVMIGAFNPLASTLLSRYEQLEARYFRGEVSLMSLSPHGLWLRQPTSGGAAFVHAERVSRENDTIRLADVSVFRLQEPDRFVDRLEAKAAVLDEGFWNLDRVWIMRPGRAPERVERFRLDTDLTVAKVQDSFASPGTLSFWNLPGFIEVLEQAGFSAIRHRLYWHTMLSTPLILCAMVLLAAGFSLRPARRSGTLFALVAGTLTGFVFYVFERVVAELGQSAALPVVMAAWTPASVGLLLGVALLLHLEDG